MSTFIIRNIEIKSEWDKLLTWLYHPMGLLDFHCTCEILSAVHLKHSGLCPSADVKPGSTIYNGENLEVFNVKLGSFVSNAWTYPLLATSRAETSA